MPKLLLLSSSIYSTLTIPQGNEGPSCGLISGGGGISSCMRGRCSVLERSSSSALLLSSVYTWTIRLVENPDRCCSPSGYIDLRLSLNVKKTKRKTSPHINLSRNNIITLVILLTKLVSLISQNINYLGIMCKRLLQTHGPYKNTVIFKKKHCVNTANITEK